MNVSLCSTETFSNEFFALCVCVPTWHPAFIHKVLLLMKTRSLFQHLMAKKGKGDGAAALQSVLCFFPPSIIAKKASTDVDRTQAWIGRGE